MKSALLLLTALLTINGFAEAVDFTASKCEDLRKALRHAGSIGEDLNGQHVWSDFFGADYGQCPPWQEPQTVWVTDRLGEQCPLGYACSPKTVLDPK